MKLAIISDIHDHRQKLRKALEMIQDTDLLICCGDLCSPFIMRDLGSGYPHPIHIVFGNNDGDRYRLTQVAGEFEHIHLYGEIGELLVAEKRLVMCHFDNIGRRLATSADYDVVCYGHNHQYEVGYETHTLKINPGEIMGELSGVSTFVIYDTDSGAVKRCEMT